MVKRSEEVRNSPKRSLKRVRVPIHPDVLIVGGGIAGIHAALTLANAGKGVYLVEREPNIGGHMARFDRIFPTLDRASSILTPKMASVRDHPNIHMLTYSEVESVDGSIGNYTVKVRRKARFVYEDLCTSCAKCVKACPVTLPSEFDENLGERKAIYLPYPEAVPNVYLIDRKGTPPCQAACPIHQNAEGYITMIAKGRFPKARELILRDNPLPSICGRICTHPCTEACTRMKLDEAVNVPGLKRFVMDMVSDYKLPRVESEREERVAIVGSGPAGLMCAYELRMKGYKPVIYESLPVAGGMLTVGIPEFRLPRKILNAEIKRFADIGITIRLNSPVGKEVTLDELRREYSAVFIGIGAHIERRLGIPGEDLGGVWGGIDFLRKVNLGEEIRVGERVLVIGGGNSALDAARTALRCGARSVTIVYRRTRGEMPAEPHEIFEAEREGVKIHFLAAPKAILDKGIEKELVCQRMELGEPDSSGRPRPVPIPDSDFGILCDEIIVTIGQKPDLEGLGERLGLDTSRWETFSADPLTLETNIPGIFAGGDCVTGPDVVINAMSAGRKAAISIDRFIKKEEMRLGRELEGPYKCAFEVDISGEPLKKRIAMPAIPLEKRGSFEEVYSGYTKEMAMEEAARCLECAVCCDCRNCSLVCEPNAIDYFMKDEVVEMKVGTILLATGFKTSDARKVPQYGYGRYPNVYTGLEVERLLNPSGPTKGEIILRDGKKPKTVGIIHCGGARDQETDRLSSRISSMLFLKLARLIKEGTDAKVYNFFLGNGKPGKGYEEFYERLLKEGVQFISSRVDEVTDNAMTPEEEGRLVIRAEDTKSSINRRIPVDMVVLSMGLEPQGDAHEVGRLFNISTSSHGFFLERHPTQDPVDTFTDGIFIAGCCQGPKDIPDTVGQAGETASEILTLIDKGYVGL